MSDKKSIEEPAPSAEDADGTVVSTTRTMQEIIMGTVRSGPAFHPLFDKFEPQHVTQFLKQSFESDAAKHKTLRGDRWFQLAYVILGVGMFGFLTVLLLPSQPDLYFQILQGIGLFGGGLAGGYGIRAYQGRRSARRR